MESERQSLESLLAEAVELAGMERFSSPSEEQRAREVQKELRERGNELYLQPGGQNQAVALFRVAGILKNLLAVPRVWGQRFETLDAGMLETPIRNLELSPFEIRNYVAARLVTTMDGVDMVKTDGLRVGLGVVNKDDSRLGKRSYSVNGVLSFPEIKETLTKRKQYAIRRRSEDLEGYMFAEAYKLGFPGPDFASLSLVNQKLGTDDDYKLDLYDEGNAIFTPPAPQGGEVGQELIENADSVFRLISHLDQGPYIPHQVGSVNDGGRARRR